MSQLVYGITRIVSHLQQTTATDPRQLLIDEFLAAYVGLYAGIGQEGSLPDDLYIHLSIRTNKPLEHVRYEED